MRLVIAEKYSLAQQISGAGVLPRDVQVTNCSGHMLEMAKPEDYDPKWKLWDMSTLPMLIKDWRLLPKPENAAQLARIGKLLASASEVIHAGDPDREGQLLVDEVLDYFKFRGPVKRMLIQDIAPGGIKRAWENLRDNREFQPMRRAAECRQRADWLVGLNVTRAVTKELSEKDKVPVGRVMSPTLALVVKRHKAIHSHQEQIFFTLRASFSLSGGRSVQLKCEPDPRIADERIASTLAKAAHGQSARIEVVHEEKTRLSPHPFKLSTYQKAAEKHFGWSLDQAEKALQVAYENGWVSYPRSGCPYLPTEHKPEAVALGLKVAGAIKVDERLTEELAPKNRVYDSKKVKEINNGAHYGIVPTMSLPPADADQQAVKAWKLISLHFLRTLMPDEEYTETRVKVVLQTGQAAPYDTIAFTGKGEVPDGEVHWGHLDIGSILPSTRKRERKETEETPLPRMDNGESATCTECTRAKGKTTPPKPYTEAALVDDMENVAKYVTDPKMREVLKDTKGIGTDATRKSIVKKLIAERLILSNSKTLVLSATKFGIACDEAIPAQLTDPVLTAAWEKALDLISKGEYEPATFMAKVENFVTRQLGLIREAKSHGTRIAARGDAPPAGVRARKSGAGKPKKSGPPASGPTRKPAKAAARKPESGEPKGQGRGKLDDNGFI